MDWLFGVAAKGVGENYVYLRRRKGTKSLPPHIYAFSEEGVPYGPVP
jgi:hypothetical protein